MDIEHNNIKTDSVNNTKCLILTAFAMAITLVFKLFFYFVPFLNGYGIELHLVGYVYGLMLIKNYKWVLTYAFITPWFLLICPPSFANFWDLLLEYIVALYIFIPMIWFRKIMGKLLGDDNKRWVLQTTILCICMLILFCLKLFIHTIAGVLWWTPGQWWGSFIFNLPIYATTLGISIPVIIVSYKPLIILSENSHITNNGIVQ